MYGLIKRFPFAMLMLGMLMLVVGLPVLASLADNHSVTAWSIPPWSAVAIMLMVWAVREEGRQSGVRHKAEKARAIEEYATRLGEVWNEDRARRFRVAVVDQQLTVHGIWEIYKVFLSPVESVVE